MIFEMGLNDDIIFGVCGDCFYLVDWTGWYVLDDGIRKDPPRTGIQFPMQFKNKS